MEIFNCYDWRFAINFGVYFVSNCKGLVNEVKRARTKSLRHNLLGITVLVISISVDEIF